MNIKDLDGMKYGGLSCRGPSVLDLHESRLDRITHESGHIVNIKTLHNLRTVRLYSLDADVQLQGHLLGRLSFGDQTQDLPLPRRQLLLARPILTGPLHIFRDGRLRERRTQVDFSSYDRTESQLPMCQWTVLLQINSLAGTPRLSYILLACMP